MRWKSKSAACAAGARRPAEIARRQNPAHLCRSRPIMAYFRTVLTYQLPSEAELDKSFLEAQGITVYLVSNLNTGELGPAFWVRLQVAEADWPSATQILHEARPERFGSATRVDELDRVIKRGAVSAFAGA